MSQSSSPSGPSRQSSRFGFDPQRQPWVPVEDGLGPIPSDSLSPDHLRRILAVELIGTTFAAQEDGRHDVSDGVSTSLAAVLIGLVSRPEGVTVILTERASHLRHHAGQISFPGGRVETSDASPQAAALREANEETALPREHVELMGVMSPYWTTTGFSITPVVGLVRPGFHLVADAQEVSAIFEVPLVYLMDPRHYRLHSLTLPDGRERRYYSVTWDRFFVWGATAAILRNLYHVLHMSMAGR